jgi:hypothetical protein
VNDGIVAKPSAAESWAFRAGFENAVVLALLFLLWLSLLDFPSFVAGGDNLDSSWQQALGYFLTHRFQAGVDYVFTYGPLGYFHTTAYVPELFWWKYAWEIGMKAAIVITLGMLAFRQTTFIVRVLFCLCCLLFLPESHGAVLTHHTDGTYNLFLFSLGILPLLQDRIALKAVLPITVLLAVLSLVKFTLMVAAIGVVGVFAVALLLEGRPGASLLPLATYLSVWIAAWICLGQNPSNVQPYLAGSLQISTGYSEGMALEGDPRRVPLALLILGLFVGVLWLFRRSRTRECNVATKPPAAGSIIAPPGRQTLKLALLVFFLFMGWKHGLVRNDIHGQGFFNFTLLLPFILPVMFPHSKLSATCMVLLILAVPLSIIGRGHELLGRQGILGPVLRIERGAEEVFLPWKLLTHLETEEKRMRQVERDSALQEIVGNETIDELTMDQHVLFLNELNYRPRPVFQSYSAYTPQLLAQNALFFQSECAPRFLLLQLETIDGRVPDLDDGPALLAILRRYRFVEQRGPYLLLKRTGETDLAEDRWPDRNLLDADIGFDESLSLADLPGAHPRHVQVLRLDFAESGWGKLRKALLRPPPVFIDVYFDHGEEGMRSYRLIPSMAQSGFLIDPFLEDTADVRDALQGKQGKKLTGIRLRCPEGGQRCFEDLIRVKVTETER